ncbi:hypothetical protein [Terriglobus sp.]|uniref:hypothetical protein n=1 Tax=Terriglobus sp. TaxID=1889013 RepID=UPI003AFF72B4
MIDIAAGLPQLLPAAIAWAEEQERIYAERGRPLNDQETKLAQSIGVMQPDSVRLAVVSGLPTPTEPVLRAAANQIGLTSAAGLTLGHTILLTQNHLKRVELFSHEMVHVRQMERAGSLADFLAVYLQRLFDHGYWDAPFEVEARAHEVLSGPRQR